MDCINFLSKKNFYKRDKNLIFDKEKHIYHVKRRKEEYLSVTTLVKKIFPEFDTDAVIECLIKNNKNYIGKDKETIKKEWEKNGKIAAEAGTRLHYNIELYNNNCGVDDNSIEFKHYLNFLRDHPELEPYRTEWQIYDNDYKIAGTIDMVYKNKNNGKYYIYDWKRVKQLKLKCFKMEDTALYPFNNIPNTNSYHYFIQLNLYKTLLEKNYDIKIEGLFLCQLYPSRKSYNVVESPNMEDIVFEILRIRAMQLKDNIDNFQLPIYIDTTDIDNKGKKRTSKKLVKGKCIFPFKYKKKIYSKCANSKNGKWCATKLTKKNYTKYWGYCKETIKGGKRMKKMVKLICK